MQSGYTARSRLEPALVGGVPAFQLGDLKTDEPFDPSSASRYELDPPFERYWAAPGDLVFRSRGDRNTAVVIDPLAAGKAIALQPLIVLRPDRALVDPKYLAWAISQPAAQRYFDKVSLGTSMRMIPKQSLDDLELYLPEFETQRLIVEVDALARREHELAGQLADRKLDLMSFTLQQRAQSR